jgi:DNA-binding transcriptional ArsR family regulator
MLSPREHKRLQKYIHDIDIMRLTAVFDALGEPNRCLIFRTLLKNHDINVSQIADINDISVSLASQHLKVLLQAGLVDKQKDGKKVYYHVNSQDALVHALGKAVEG